MFDGTYSYRFNGYSKDAGVPHYLVGVGVMNMTWDADAKLGAIISGEHMSTASPLIGGGGLNAEAFTLTGAYAPSTASSWTATITFTSTDVTMTGEPVQVLQGSFALVPAGDKDRFWLVSTGATIKTTGDPADEVVSGEAVRLTAAPVVSADY